MEKQKDIEKLSEVMELQELPLEYTGITLNNQDIDLMMIANATTPTELKVTLEDITNISIDISDVEMGEAQFQQLRQQVFDSYMELISERL